MRICSCQEVVQASSLLSNVSIQIQLVALQLSFSNFPAGRSLPKFRLVQKSLPKTLTQLTAHRAQPRWPLSSCLDSIWHICAPLHTVPARILIDQPDLLQTDYFCHSFPRGFIQDSSCSTTLHSSRTHLSLPVRGCLVSMTNIKCCCQAFKLKLSSWTEIRISSWIRPQFQKHWHFKTLELHFHAQHVILRHSPWCSLACILPNRIISPGGRPMDY